MIQPKATHRQASRLLVLSNNPHNYQLLHSILAKYFPPTTQGHLQLSTKYYTALVQISVRQWPSRGEAVLSLGQSEQFQASPEDKQDLLVMLAGAEESFEAEVYDFVIGKYNPDNFLVIVNTAERERVWRDEAVIAGQVNNFIEVVKEDLRAVEENPPERGKTGLLAENCQDGSILTLLELMETTQWSLIERVGQSSVNKSIQAYQKEEDKASHAEVIEKKEQLSEAQTVQTKQQLPVKQVSEQLSEQQLQQQMLGFQSMLHQMMSVKAMAAQPQGAPADQRKRKAQDLISRLLQGTFL